MKSTMDNLGKMLDPRRIAVVGATERKGTVGRRIMENLLMLAGVRVYPVNAARKTVLGIEARRDIGSIPEQVELAVIATPARTVPEILEDCGRRGVNGVVVVSAGFREMGEEGKRLEDRIEGIAGRYEMRILGPESAGFARPVNGFNATFLRSGIAPGNIAFLSQNAGLSAAIVDWAASTGIGFSMIASLGTMIDVDLAELIDFLGDDYATKSILIYMETIGNTRRFMSAARAVASRKPIIVLKPGRFGSGPKETSSCRGQAGDDEIYDAAFRRAGILRVGNITELFNSARILDSERLPRGQRVAIITNAGPPGILAADALVQFGGELANLSDKSLEEMKGYLPPHWRTTNPVNLLAFADIVRYTKVLETCLRDPMVDGVLVLYVPEESAPSEALAGEIARTARTSAKPVIATWMGAGEVESGRRVFIEHDIPVFKTPEDAVRTYILMYRRKRNLDHLYETPAELPVRRPSDKERLKATIRQMRADDRTILSKLESKEILAAYGIAVAASLTARDADEAVIIAERLGYPVRLRMVSQAIPTKSETGTTPGICSRVELRKAWENLAQTGNLEIPHTETISVEPVTDEVDYELTLAARKDREFGTVISLGLAGAAAEFFREYSIALPPLNQTLAKMLIEETKAYSLLRGFRGRRPADFEELEEVLVCFSNLVVDFPELAEICIDPLTIANGKPCAMGARMVLDREYLEQRSGYPHLVIKPYPTQYTTTWKTRDGLEVLLRPIRPEDEPLEREMFASLSEETIRMRLLAPVKNILSHERMIGFCNIDYHRHMAVIAQISEKGKRRMIGVGRLVMTPDFSSGEFAVLVHDQYQRHGLGKKLIEVLIEIGREKGLDEIVGEMLSENRKMLKLAAKMGFTSRQTCDETTEVRLDLRHHQE